MAIRRFLRLNVRNGAASGVPRVTFRNKDICPDRNCCRVLASHLHNSLTPKISTPGGTPRGPASPLTRDIHADTGGLFNERFPIVGFRCNVEADVLSEEGDITWLCGRCPPPFFLIFFCFGSDPG